MYKLSKLIQLTENRGGAVTPPTLMRQSEMSAGSNDSSKEQMPYCEFVSSLMDQYNYMLEHLNQQMDRSIFEIQEKVLSLHAEAAVKYGQNNYNFEWQLDSPSLIQQKVQHECATLTSLINKEKARLAILLMSYRQDMKK